MGTERVKTALAPPAAVHPAASTALAHRLPGRLTNLTPVPSAAVAKEALREVARRTPPRTSRPLVVEAARWDGLAARSTAPETGSARP